MATYTEEEQPEASAEMTLFGAVRDLNGAVNSLESLVFGERPKEEESKKVQAGDRITEARNIVREATSMIELCNKRLSLIGK